MRIAIDAHHIGLQRTGSETYVSNLVRNLALLEPNGEQYAVYMDPRQNLEGVKSKPCFEIRNIPTSIPHVRFGMFYPVESWYKFFDVFHSQYSVPPLLRGRSVLTVYDLTFERFPEFFSAKFRRQMKALVRWSCHRADHVITISESSKRDLVEIYRLDPKRVTVTYPAAAENCRPLASEQAAKYVGQNYGVEGPFVLYVGNLEPRKNLQRLLEAFAHLKQKELISHKLVIVGQKAWLYDGIFETIRSYSLEREVVLTGYVPTNDLAFLYNAASILIYPSIFEGFGLPVIEAMACGTPVITSLGSSLEEIAKDAAVLVDPYSVSSIAAAIEKVANDASLRGHLRRSGLAQAAQYSYVRMAEQTRSVYHQL